MNNNEAEAQDQETLLRREMDRVQAQRLTAISGIMARLQLSLDASLKEITQIQTSHAAMIERLTAFNERFVEHDRREGEDRIKIIATLERITDTLGTHGQDIKAHGEVLGTLKQWNMLLAAAIGALASGGVGWIIQHLQTTVIR